MQIIFDCERMKYPYTGLFEYCYQLGNALEETKSPDDHITLFIPKKNTVHFSENEFLIQNSIHKLIFPTLPASAKVWHATYQTSKYVPPKRINIKRVLTIHDLNFLYEEKSEKKRENYLKKHQKIIDKVDHIIAISEFTKNDILKYLKVDVPVSVIYNGCNIDTSTLFNYPNYKPEKPFIFALGTVNSKKNFHVLPKLLQDENLELIIAGKTDLNYVEKINEEAKKYNVEEKVKIIGSISTEEKCWYYKNCLAFMFPSLAEGFGIPVIEAMSFGKPVFLSKSTSLPEIGGELAYYFENFIHDDMLNVFKNGMNHYNAKQPSNEIIKHAQMFSWLNAAKEYWSVYKSLV